MKKKTTVLIVTAAALVVALALALPAIVTAMADGRALQTGSPAAAQADALSAEGMELPIARSLYLARQQTGLTGYESYKDGGTGETPDTAPALFRTLAAAGLMPAEGDELYAFVHTETGLATALHWQTAEDETQSAERLASYAAYLGLAGLDDWEEMAQQGGTTAVQAIYSPAAQLYLAHGYAESTKSASLWVTSLSPPQIEEMRHSPGAPVQMDVPFATATGETGPAYGQWRQLSAGNTRGYYQIEYIANIWYAQASYINYETAEWGPLCSLPGCTHNDESCASWLPYGEANRLYADDGKLFWLSPSPIEIENELGYNVYPHIDMSEPDGTGRKRLVVYGENHFIDYNCIFSDGNYLAFTLTEIHPKTRDTLARSFIIISQQTGETVAEYPLNINEIPYIQGAYNGGFLFYSTERRGEEREVFQHRLCTLSLPGGEVEELYRWNPEDGPYTYFIFHQDALYAINKEARQLQRLALPTMEVEQVLFTLPEEWQYSSFEIWDDHFLLSASLPNENRAVYTLPVAGGEAVENTLTRTHKGEISPLWIRGETAGEFLVCIGSRYYPQTLIGTGGAPYTIQQERLVYAMITKEDFYASRPNYREITEYGLVA